jgi:hypothetical protein
MKVRIKGTGVNLAKSVKEDIHATFVKMLDKYNYDAACQLLHILHFEFGWGEKRLQRFASCLTQMQKEQRERYELNDEDTPWICAEQLRRDGIDIAKMLKGGSSND